MLNDNDADAIARAFVLGTGRTPAPVAKVLPQLAQDPKAELKALALVGQRLRFRKLAPDRAFDPPPPTTADPRRTIPEAARILLRRLLSAKTSTPDSVGLAIADAMARRRLRLHVFDLPRLDGFVQRHAEQLGAGAIAWAAQSSKTDMPEPSDYFEPEALDASNWLQAGPATRAAFIRALRRSDADHARSLVEAAIGGMPAPARLRLIGALATGLSPADEPFLQGLKADRAPTVRDAVQALLARIPGTEAEQTRLRDLVGRIKLDAGGPGRARFNFVFPATAPSQHSHFQPQDWMLRNQEPVGLEALAAALGQDIDTLIAGVAGDAALTAFLARQCMIEGRHDRLAALVRGGDAEDIWKPVVALLAETEPEWATADWAKAALAPERWSALPHAFQLVQLYQLLRAPLPPETAAALLAGTAWRAMAAEATREENPISCADLATVLAALVPASVRPDLRQALEPLPGRETARARMLLDCLDLLDPA